MEMQWLGYVLGLLPLSVLVLWWWNERVYVAPVKARCCSSNARLPPGHLGLPVLGEMLTFLYYFKLLRRPDGFIDSKRRRYGDNVGAYRSYLFGSPCIIACSPSLCKFVLNSSDSFKQEWSPEVFGTGSILVLQGHHHDRVKSFLMNAINRPDALGRIALQIQPSIVAAIQSWSQKRKVSAIDEVKKVTFENMGRYFASFEPGPQLDDIEKLFLGVSKGFRAQPWNLPGTAYRHAIKCREKLIKILKEELDKRKQNKKNESLKTTSDLIDGLMEMKDEEGNQLKDEEVLDNVLSSINSGYLSVAYLVPWSMYFLAKYPVVLQKLQEENRSMSKEKNGAYITYEDILKLKYTNKVVEETIRMANLSYCVPRKATGDIEFKGYIIPKGWKVIVWLRYLHVDAENFEDPMCFKPERWDDRPRSGTYLPFGGGARTCPGSTLVRIHLAIFLHHLSVKYKWKLLNPDTTIRYLPHPTPTDGLEVSVSNI